VTTEFVIALYHPKPGRDEELEALVRAHTQLLRSRGLITSREAVLLRARGGALLEIFEWVSPAAVDEAHADEEVQHIWRRLADVAEFGQLASLEEAHLSFPHFTAV
jgi:hypothetical protein